jgi:TolA-binding protein
MHDKEINMYTQALKFAQDEFYLDAATQFQKLIDEFPDSELSDDAQYNIGLCYFTINNFQKAIDSFEIVIAQYPEGTISILDSGNEFGKTAAKCHYAIVNCYLALGNIDQARLHANTLNKFDDSYVINDDKKIFYSELAKLTIDKFNNLN